MFELKPCCPDHTTPMIHNLKSCIPFDNLLDVFLFTLRQGWGSRDCTAARGLTCIRCGWGSSLIKVQRKSVLQPAIRASCTLHVLTHKSFQLAQNPLISKIDYNPSVIWIFPKNSTCPSGKLRTKITGPIAKSTSPGLSDTTFFARWSLMSYKV